MWIRRQPPQDGVRHGRLVWPPDEGVQGNHPGQLVPQLPRQLGMEVRVGPDMPFGSAPDADEPEPRPGDRVQVELARRQTHLFLGHAQELTQERPLIGRCRGTRQTIVKLLQRLVPPVAP